MTDPSPPPSLPVLSLSGRPWRAGSSWRWPAALALLALGALSHFAAARGMATSPVGAAAARRQAVTAHVTLVGDPEPRRYGAIAEATLSGAHVLLAAPRPASSRLLVLEAGDRIGIEGRLAPLEHHERHWAVRHVVARLSVSDVTSLSPPPSPLTRAANAARRRVLDGHRALPPLERAVVAALLVGDTRGLPEHVDDSFRASGLSHLLVVSGSNVAFVLALAGPLLRRLRLGSRLAVGLGTVLLFAAMTRFEPSVLRASAMAAIVMTGEFAGRPVAGLRVLGAAVAGLVVLDPFLVRSVSFGLSVSASAGILLLAPVLRRRLPDVVATTTAAQLGVAPLALVTFGAPPLVAVPANVVAAPLAGALTVVGATTGLLGGALHTTPLLEGLAPVVALPAGLLARALVTVAEVFAGVAGGG